MTEGVPLAFAWLELAALLGVLAYFILRRSR
jgi:hypothetical protein